MSLPQEIYDSNKCLGDWNILHGYRGSISHGTYRPPTEPNSIDDKDTMGICVPTEEYYLGLKDFHRTGTLEIKKNEWDIVVYELKKFIRLLKQGNPNVISLLWLDKTYYIDVQPEGQLLIDNRDLFMGKHIYKSFIGYAYGQLHRMTHQACQGHLGEKRKQLVLKYGYDTKNASHLIRLLRMGIEALTEGVFYVNRNDATQLVEIKRGEWTLDQVKKEADDLFKKCELAYINSSLLTKLDDDKIQDICMDIVYSRLKKYGGKFLAR